MANTIWCVGRNYKDHAVEMKAELPTEPLIFIKSWNCIDLSTTVTLPHFSQHVEHEIEIALFLGSDLQVKDISLAVDLTARDIQSQLKSKGQPWARAKSFKNSCLLSSKIPYQDDAWFNTLKFDLKVNGESKQMGLTQDMIFSPQQIIDSLVEFYPVVAGDIILSGTPAGVGPLKPGDKLKAEINDHLVWNLDVAGQ